MIYTWCFREEIERQAQIVGQFPCCRLSTARTAPSASLSATTFGTISYILRLYGTDAETQQYTRKIPRDTGMRLTYSSRLTTCQSLGSTLGGDLQGDDFAWVAWLAVENPQCDILFFTKSYDDINAYLDKHEYPISVHSIMSAWPGLKMVNPHNLPESHILYPNGETTAPQYGATFCNGNCSECHYRKTDRGCWGLEKGECVILRAH